MRQSIIVLALALAGCSSSPATHPDAGGKDVTSPAHDSVTGVDKAAPADLASGVDSGGVDVAAAPDVPSTPADAAAGDAQSTDTQVADANGDTWTNFAQTFFATYCGTCHSPGGSGFNNGTYDWRDYATVVANAAVIRCGTAATHLANCGASPPAKQFPIAAPYPSDAERDQLVRWIDSGTPQ